MRIVIIGDGKMGRAVASLAEARGHVIHALVGGGENASGRALTAERLKGADVAVEFTRPDAAVANLERLVDAGVPVVTGTTGWLDQLPRVTAHVERCGGALLHAANFSFGVHLFLRAARDLAARFAGHPEFDAFILEEHHAAKLDAPSGTARELRQRVRASDPARDFPITSIRAGTTPGTHLVAYDGQYERVTLAHVARSRGGFAAGALAAAEWLPGRRGVFTVEDMLFGGSG
ncbi:MAG TPA: dihydrodipicolinate reductase C-terminal domain-containing protein, partial [Gemmatimonadales bacterium]|nr:dihydrodipicolinate reductase C-terminal domain-containing protein [Gemmatimonadales bacterium]